MKVILEVIVPVHSIGERRADLEKLLSVGYREDTSFIVVSDSKNNNDHAIVREILEASLNPDSKVCTGDFGSPGLARNAGISISEANWISFLDSDDLISLNDISIMIANAEVESAQVAIGGIKFARKNPESEAKYFMHPALSILSNLSLMPAFTRMAFKRDVVVENAFPGFRMAEDQCFLLDILGQSPKLYIEENYFYTYQLGSSGQSTKNLTALSDLPFAIEYISSKFQKFKPEIQKVAATMVARQSISYFTKVGFFPVRQTIRIFRLFLELFAKHPLITFRAFVLILLYRPRNIL